MDSDPASPLHHLEARELSALVEASALMNQSLELSRTLHSIASAAARVLDAEAGSVLTLDPRRQRLVFAAAIGGGGENLLGEEMPADQGIAGRALQTGQPVLVDNVREDPDFFGGIDEKSSFTTRHLIAAPMLLREQPVGVVEVVNRRGTGSFTKRDVELLQLFANLAAASVTNAQRHETIRRENEGWRRPARPGDRVIGNSAPWREVLKLCERVARANASVLLLGETGTGKEVCARLIHGQSPRAERPFVAINCAALPETLLESELFGHEAGAFTGATAQKLGRFELADGGTLFLDEIGDISASTQIKLLRVLQEREFVRVGGTKTLACDVRVIAATNRDLEAAMKTGEFREDLFYRLNVFPIRLPPLRERADDIPLLVRHYAEQAAIELGHPPVSLSDGALRCLCQYRWPGNVRELRNVLERAVLMCDGDVITPELLPPDLAGDAGASEPEGPADVHTSIEGYEKAMIVKALDECGWNQTQAAKALGLSRDNLRYRLKKYAIRKPD